MHNNKIKARGSTSGLILYSQLPTQDPHLVTNKYKLIKENYYGKARKQ